LKTCPTHLDPDEFLQESNGPAKGDWSGAVVQFVRGAFFGRLTDAFESMNESDLQWMERALELAERGRGHVEPNPLVGAVVVREGKVVGEGWHEKYGQAHAEINALAAAGEAARGATLYVSLEPCCHHGKTPPCTDAILRAGIGRVIVAMLDPYPAVSGRGAHLLRESGLRVEMGLCEEQARRLNAPYLKLVTSGRPYVHAKWAMTLDGKIATRTGDSKWISNDRSRQLVHSLRGRMDAIVTGIGSVLADDPLLTARPPGPRTATRIVLDSSLRLPANSRLATTARDAPVLIATAGDTSRDRASTLRQLGCELLPIDTASGKPSVPALLTELGKRRCTNLLIEGGMQVMGSFLDAGAIDEVHVFIAPHLFGGSAAKTPIGGLGVDRLVNALTVTDWKMECIDDNCYFHGCL
jgi:diaminohydroxyphosphoribosylaminopyrimidine deaminase / 5-amino-6-(5-phosphoribosylamino)uracil reductase